MQRAPRCVAGKLSLGDLGRVENRRRRLAPSTPANVLYLRPGASARFSAELAASVAAQLAASDFAARLPALLPTELPLLELNSLICRDCATPCLIRGSAFRQAGKSRVFLVEAREPAAGFVRRTFSNAPGENFNSQVVPVSRG